MLLFLRLNPFPTLDHLWSNLAETRRVRRRVTQSPDYAAFYGITTPERVARLLVSLRLRERLLERKVARMGNTP